MTIRAFAVCAVSFLLLFHTDLRADGPQSPRPTPLATDPNTDANQAPTIDPLPDGWKHTQDTPEKHQGERGDKPKDKAFFETTGAEKTMKFDAWCKKIAAKETKETPINDDKETELKASKIGPYNVMSFDITGTLFLNPVHCRFYFIELPNQYARLLCNSNEETWPKIEGQLDEMVKNMR